MAGVSPSRQVGVSIINGAYMIPEQDGPTFGKYRVEIMGYEFEEAPEGSEEEEVSTQIVPPQYNTESTLELEISEPKMEKDFALTTD